MVERHKHMKRVESDKPADDDDTIRVAVADDIRTSAGLVAVEFPLAIMPTQAGQDSAMGMIGGMEQLTRVAADAVGSFSICGVKTTVSIRVRWTNLYRA